MALKEKIHAARGNLGERSKKDEKIVKYPKKRRQKKKKKKVKTMSQIRAHIRSLNTYYAKPEEQVDLEQYRTQEELKAIKKKKRDKKELSSNNVNDK